MLTDQRHKLWSSCTVTLSSEPDGEYLIIHYFKANKSKELKLSIFDITCVVRVYNQSHTNCLAIHTAVRTMERSYIMLAALSEKELNEWITTLNASCQKARKCEGVPKPSALWCTTCWGDVFFSDAKDESGSSFSKSTERMDHCPIRQTFEFRKSINTIGKSVLNFIYRCMYHRIPHNFLSFIFYVTSIYHGLLLVFWKGFPCSFSSCWVLRYRFSIF